MTYTQYESCKLLAKSSNEANTKVLGRPWFVLKAKIFKVESIRHNRH